MTRWKLIIEYDGRPFSGWQSQDHAPSVQQAIEEALYKFCQQTLRVHVAGRTDAGVHARGQVAHFDLDYGTRPLAPSDLCKALNALLRPLPIAILEATPVSEDFHARFSAKMKHYQYRILNRSAPPTTEEGLVWHVRRPLNEQAMDLAAKHLLGRHDFSTFRDSQCQAKSPVRSLDRFDVSRRDETILFDVEGRSFLHHQVRNMVGTLVLIGKGKWNQDDLCTALESKDRRRGGMTAPAGGLTLVRILY